ERRGRMAEETQLAVVPFEKVEVARPHQHIRICLGWGLSRNQPCVNIDRLFVFVIERQASEEFNVFVGKLYIRYVLQLIKLKPVTRKSRPTPIFGAQHLQ